MPAAAIIPAAITPSAETGLRLLFQHAPFGIAQCASEGSVLALNPALERILGGLRLEHSPVFGDLLDSLADPQVESKADSQADSQFDSEARTVTERMFREMVSGTRESIQLQSRASGAPEGSASVKWTAWRVPASAETPAFGLVMAQEVSDEALDNGWISQRLRQAERLEAVGRLAGGVAHDFNNLLTGVILYCDLLLAGLESGNRLRNFAEEIRAAGMQASGLVRQLMGVARPQTQEPRPVSLNQVVQETQDLLLRLIGENIVLQFHLDPNLGLIIMDPSQVQQIFLNLVLNARDAMPGGGQIKIETSNCMLHITGGHLAENPFAENPVKPVPCALFVVSDNGKGMDAEARKHLFEAFYTTKPSGQGTGLGLATVHNLVTASGGLIYADSEPGRGTRMTVILPLAPGLSEIKLSARTSVQEASLQETSLPAATNQTPETALSGCALKT